MVPGVWDLFSVLEDCYGPQNWWPADTPFEVCVGAILTQNTSWSNVEKAVSALKHRGLLRPEILVAVRDDELKELIKPSGFYNQKADRLKAFSHFLLDNGGFEGLGELPVNLLRESLLTVKGIGRETADSMILYAFHKPSFVVDAYTKRLLYRLGIIPRESEDYDKVKRIFEVNIFPVDENLYVYQEFHALIVKHVKEVCLKKNPKCSICCLSNLCSRKGVGG